MTQQTTQQPVNVQQPLPANENLTPPQAHQQAPQTPQAPQQSTQSPQAPQQVPQQANEGEAPEQKKVETPYQEPFDAVKSNNPLNDNLSNHIKDAQIGGLSLSPEAAATKAKLAKEPRMPFMIPLEGGEKKGEAYRPVIINGYRFEVKKGVMITDMPVTVAKLLMESMNIEVSTLQNHETNLNFADSEKKRALNL